MKLDLRSPRMFFAMLMLAFVVGCSSLVPQTFSESLLATETGATTARQIGEQAALTGKLKKSQAQFVQNQADLVVAGVKSARDLRLTDPKSAADQLQMTADILKSLQTFLASQGAVATGAKK